MIASGSSPRCWPWLPANQPKPPLTGRITIASAGSCQGYFLDLRSQPGPGAPSLGHVSADSQCLRNLGCQGGVSFEEFSTLSSEAQKLRAAANPRWCKVDYRGTTGWVEGRFVAEGACPTGAEGGARKVIFPAGRSGVTLKGRIKGYEFVDYLLPAGAGQTLLVALNGSTCAKLFQRAAAGFRDRNVHRQQRRQPLRANCADRRSVCVAGVPDACGGEAQGGQQLFAAG